MENVDLLGVFVDVVEQGSFLKAADMRKTSPGQISRQIKRLEDNLDVTLIHRSTRGLYLSEIGSDILKMAHEVKSLTKKISGISDKDKLREFKIVADTSINKNIFYKILIEAKKDFPSHKIKILFVGDEFEPAEYDFDIYLSFSYQESYEGEVVKMLRNEFLIPVASPTFFMRNSKPSNIQELSRLPAIVHTNMGRLSNEISYYTHCNTLSTIKMNIVSKYNEMSVLLDSLYQGIGYTLLPVSHVKEDLIKGKLVTLLPMIEFSNNEKLYLIMKSNHHNFITKSIINRIKQSL